MLMKKAQVLSLSPHPLSFSIYLLNSSLNTYAKVVSSGGESDECENGGSQV